MADMRNEVKVNRANVILRVPEEQLDYYLAQGYNLIDDAGNVLRESVSNDTAGLRKKLLEKQAEIDNLKKELAKVKNKKKSVETKK